MIGPLMMCVSAVILLAGMLAGIVMGIEQDFALAPAHAHLNLVGGVMLFLFGLFYRLVPSAGTSRLALGVAIVILKGEALIAIPIVGSLIVTAATALFVVIVFRTAQA